MEEILILDENFRNYILRKLNKLDDYKITKEDCESITFIDCSYKNIKNLDGVKYFTNLKYLFCYENQLTILDVSKNIALKYLSCHNNKLTCLDLSNNIELTNLWCSYSQLTSLDLSKNIELVELYCSNNQLTSLDLSKNNILNNLNYGGNKLICLNLNRNPYHTITYYKSIITNFNTLTIQI